MAGVDLMRVVLIHRYFSPDTPPYAHILRSIALRLGEDGHEVTVLTCQPSYNRKVIDRAPRGERLSDNVTVRRWRVVDDRSSSLAKGFNLVTFCIRLLFSRLRVGRVDAVMAASAPPIAIAKAGSLLARLCGARFVYHKQDIYPEVAVATGLLSSRRTEGVLRALDARTDRAADRVVVLSDDMGETERGRGVRADQLRVLNNFDPWPDVGEGSLPTEGAEVRVVFAGNLGRFQALPTLMDAIKLVHDETALRFDFVGEGAMRAQLEADAAHLERVTFHGYQPPERVAAFLQQHATIGVVSLEPGVIRAAYPSKTLSYLKNRCPILAVVEPDSELARRLVGSGAGLQADPGDAAAVGEALRKLAAAPDELSAMAQAAGDLYRQEFSAARRLDEWSALFAELERGT